jgi:hypothetical protein
LLFYAQAADCQNLVPNGILKNSYIVQPMLPSWIQLRIGSIQRVQPPIIIMDAIPIRVRWVCLPIVKDYLMQRIPAWGMPD